MCKIYFKYIHGIKERVMTEFAIFSQKSSFALDKNKTKRSDYTDSYQQHLFDCFDENNDKILQDYEWTNYDSFCKECEERYGSGETDEQREKITALQDMTQKESSNETDPAADKENKSVEQYSKLNSAADNPFLDEINELQSKYNELAAKSDRTDGENRQLEQLNIQITQLKFAALAYMDKLRENKETVRKESDLSGQIGETITLKKDKNGELSGTDTTNFTLNYKNNGTTAAIGTNFTDKLFEHGDNTGTITGSLGYADKNIGTIKASAGVTSGGDNTKVAGNLYWKKENLSAAAGYQLNKNDSSTTKTYSLDASYKNANLGVTSSADGTKIYAGGEISFDTYNSKSNKVSAALSEKGTYNFGTNSTVLNSQAGVTGIFNLGKDVKLNGSINDLLTATYNKDSSPVYNNTLTAKAGLEVKDLNLNGSYSLNNNGSGTDTQTLGLGASYDINNKVTISTNLSKSIKNGENNGSQANLAVKINI